jgi:hypothetical protein
LLQIVIAKLIRKTGKSSYLIRRLIKLLRNTGVLNSDLPCFENLAGLIEKTF